MKQAEPKPTKLTRKERNLVALLARLARAASIQMRGFAAMERRTLGIDLRDVEYELRTHWRLPR